MRTEDLILVSVDDHVVEPPDMFVGRVAGEMRGPGPEGRPHEKPGRLLDLRGEPDSQHRPERGRRAPTGGVRDGADLLQRDAHGVPTTSTSGCGT